MEPVSKGQNTFGVHRDQVQDGDGIPMAERTAILSALTGDNADLGTAVHKPTNAGTGIPPEYIHTPTPVVEGQERQSLVPKIYKVPSYGTFRVVMEDASGKRIGQGRQFGTLDEAKAEVARLKGELGSASTESLGNLLEQSIKLRENENKIDKEVSEKLIATHKSVLKLDDQKALDSAVGDLIGRLMP